MKLIFLLPLLTLVSLSEQTYDDVNKTSSIKTVSYGTQAAKDIRAIGRSYAYQLIKKEKFTDYVGEAKKILDDDSLEFVDKAKKYAEDYTVHIAVVGAGIVVAILLFLGFLLTPFCCCCCNKSQKQDSGMAMWRMIWGAILVILLAANIAGLAILAVSGHQVLTLEDETTSTVDTLGDGFAKYLDETDKQVETLRSNQLKAFIGKLSPLFDNAVSDTVTRIPNDNDAKNAKDTTKNFLDSMNTLYGQAETNIADLETKVNTLTGTVNALNTNLKQCETSATQCDADNNNAKACTQKGIGPDKFAQPFDTSIMDSSKITEVKTKLADMKTFDGKTLGEWSAEVESQWNNLAKTVEDNDAIKNAKSEYAKVLTNAETEVNKVLQDDVQSKLKEYKGKIETEKTDINKQLTANIAYITKVMLLQEGDKANVWEPLVENTEEGIGKYVPFALFVLICVILGLLVLTVIVGLLATIFGCCKVSDDVLPTERDSGVCGNLLMCTSYCSVILCAIACFVAAILVTVVIATEGTCKQYNDGDLIGSIKQLGVDLGVDVDLGKLLKDALKLQSDVDVQEVIDNCAKNQTIVKAFKIEKDTKILDLFSFDQLKKDVDAKITEFDIAKSVENLNTLIPTSVKTDLENNVKALPTYDFTKVKTDVQNAKTTTDGIDLNAISTTIGQMDQNKYDMGLCKTAVDQIKDTQIGQIDTEKAALVTSLDKMSGTTTSFDTEAAKVTTELLPAITTIETRVKAIVVEEGNKAKTTAGTEVGTFVDWTYDQFNENIASCQPVSAAYHTIMNYSCDGILIHLTLIYCGMSLVGISLLFYMCVSRCLARYFIKFGQLHPEDEGGNGWGPYPGHYAQTKL